MTHFVFVAALMFEILGHLLIMALEVLWNQDGPEVRKEGLPAYSLFQF